MSWFSKITRWADPIGHEIQAKAYNNTTVQKMDPLGTALVNPGHATQATPLRNGIDAAPTNASDSLAQGAGYYGDPNDPAYGSFTKPFDVQSFYQNLDPSYFFRLQQGQQALVNGNAAGSGALSGSAMKDLLNYNQNAASQEYGNAYNRYQTTQGNIFSRLAQMAGLGQSAAAGVGANGVALAGNAGQAIQNAGSASGAGIVGGANALNSGVGNYIGYQYLNQHPWGGSQVPAGTPAFGSTNTNYSNAAGPTLGSQFVSP